MKTISKLNLGLIAFSLLISGAAFSLNNNANPIKEAAAWSGSQTSTEGNYFASVGSQTGEALRTTLKGIISSGTSESYDWSRYEAADEAEGQSSQVLQVYTRTTIAKSAHVSGQTGWNREHSYPQSKIGSPATSDNHHIFASDNKVNGTRGNKLFGVVPETSGNQVKDSLGKLTDNYTTGSYFYPVAAARGEVARATMYLNTRYNYSITSNFQSVELMLQWHLENPVTNRDIYRNNTVHTLQKNRNPYVDHPDWACKVYGETNASTRILCNTPAVNPETVSITPSSGSVNIGSTLTLHASVLPSNASQSVVWSSSNNAIATVSNGIVTPVSVGQVSISAASSSKASVKATALITVTNDPIPVTGVNIDRPSANMGLGTTLTLNANVLPNGASNKNVNWTSSNNAIASVSASGVVSANALGTATITVTTVDGGFSDSVVVNVTEQVITSSIMGSFYNNNSANNGGEGGVTVANLNNGIASVSALGFGGQNVVKTVKTITQGYYPRSSGLALGSGNNSGTMVLELNEDYYATKVEVKFNNAGVDATTVSVSGNAAIKNQVAGSIGAEASNPSTGNAYIVEFSTPASEITITASKRTALVELIIHYGDEVIIDTSLEDATSWAMDFLELTEEGCNLASLSSLETVWQQAYTSYNELSTGAKAILNSTTPDGDGDYLEEALARYIVIIEKYPLQQFVTGLTANLPERSNLTPEKTNSLFTIVGMLTLGGIAASFFVIKKKYVNK